MDKHTLWMIIGCGLPLLLVFFAPAFGLSRDIAIFIFIAAMFICHILMLFWHGRESGDKEHNH